MGGGVIDDRIKTGLRKSKFQSAELTREEVDDLRSFRRRNQYGVNAVDDSVGSELL